MFLKSYIEKSVWNTPDRSLWTLKKVLFKENETDDGEHGNQCRTRYCTVIN